MLDIFVTVCHHATVGPDPKPILSHRAGSINRRSGKEQILINSSVTTIAGTSGRGPGREEAFTLLDLLAVLLTIAILATLMLPALAKSNDNGRRTICTNNLRQMGAAAKMYANDNQDYLAYPNWSYTFSGPGWLYSLSNGTIPDPTSGSYSNDQAAAYSPGLWFQYVQNPKSYLCPVFGTGYQVQFKDNLSNPAWQALNGSVTLIGDRGYATDFNPSSGQRFYRVMAF